MKVPWRFCREVRGMMAGLTSGIVCKAAWKASHCSLKVYFFSVETLVPTNLGPSVLFYFLRFLFVFTWEAGRCRGRRDLEGEGEEQREGSEINWMFLKMPIAARAGSA